MSETLSFADRFSKSIETRIEADKYKNTCENGVDLLENSTVFFGADTEEKRLELMDRVFTRYGKGDKSFQDIVNRSNNPTVNKNVALADKESFVNSVFIAMNASVSGSDLVTDSMSAEDIDSYLPESCKGVGVEIKKITLLKFNEEEMIKVNNVVNILDSGTISLKDKLLKIGEIKEIIKDTRISPLVRQYAEVSLTFVSSKIEQIMGNYSRGGRGQQQVRPSYGEDGERIGGVEAAWQVTPEKLAEAMLFMDSSVRWQSYTPPEWFKALPEEDQARIEYMVMVCEGASNMIYGGKDLDKVLGNKMYFSFDNEKFTKLFNGDFKLVMSKMLNDLCETYTDERTGNKCLRYKEKFYKIDKNGRFIEDANGNRIITSESDPNSRADIDQDVMKKLEGIRDYKNDLAKFLAKEAGRDGVSYMDQMNAYTAWNLFFMFGDSSIADRMRLLPTYGGIICDPVRTLNMGAKAENKLKISKGQREVGDEELFEAEVFGGQIARQVRKVMLMERDLGTAVDKKTGKRLREKIISGEFPLFQHKMAYGFLDFVGGSRDLYKGNGVDDKGEVKWEKIDASENKTLAILFMEYASFDKNGNVVSHKDENSFSLGRSQVDFLNWWRDHMEMAALANQTMMGKVEVKGIEQFAGTINDKIGMLRGVKINGRRLSYSTDPGFWANMIWGSLPIDNTIISSDFIKLRQETKKDGTVGAYSAYIDNLLRNKMGFSDTDVNINAIARYLGVEITDGTKANGMVNMVGNDLKNLFGSLSSGRLERQQANLANNVANNSEMFNGIVNRFNGIDKTTLSGARLATYKSLEMAIKAKNFALANRLINQF